jgi:hypothetical protein
MNYNPNRPTAKLRLAKLKFEEGDIKTAKEAVIFCLNQRKRPSIALQAAKLLLDHEKDIVKHEDPAAQTLVHEFPTELKIVAVKAEERVQNGYMA